jgi:hypothetical protein
MGELTPPDPDDGPSQASESMIENRFNPDQYEFFIINDFCYAGYTSTLNVFGSSYVTSSEAEITANILSEEEMSNQDFVAERYSGGLESLSEKGKNYMYIFGAAGDLWEALAPAFTGIEDDLGYVNLYGAYSYNLSAPVFSIVYGNEFDAYETSILKCDYDGAEVSTYDEKFGAVNASASVHTLITDYISDIAQDVVVSELLPWYKNNFVFIGNIQTAAANLITGIPVSSDTFILTGSEGSTTPSVGGSTAPSSTGGGY